MPKKSADGAPSIISNDKLRQLYTTMLKCRILESHVRKLDRVSYWKGKEAVAVAASIDLDPEDTIVAFSDMSIPSFLKGAPLRSILKQQPVARKQRKSLQGSQAECALATGIAYARGVENKRSITVAFLSGSPEQHSSGRESLRFAGEHKLPILYVYGGPLPDALQAYAYGFPVIPVDGYDVVAVYRVAHECTVRARQGGGPSVIACSAGSRNGASTKNDPIRNIEGYLSAKGLFMNEVKQTTIRKFENLIAAAGKASRNGKTQQELGRIFVV